MFPNDYYDPGPGTAAGATHELLRKRPANFAFRVAATRAKLAH
jgi:hypothetical protein